MKRAFTIVELLVTIAIVVILATILFPIFSRAGETSREDCLRNLRQIGLAVNAYATDYDDVVVPWLQCKKGTPGCQGGPPTQGLRIWNNKLAVYMVGLPGLQTVATQDGFYPPSGPFHCPDFNTARLLKSADAADCDGAGAADPYLDFANGVFNRPMLFADYGLAFPMCSPAEIASGKPECDTNGGAIATAGDYGRDGSTRDLAMFAHPGSQLYPTGSIFHLDRRISDIVRIHETAVASDGATMRSGSQFFFDFLGCEGAFIHVNGSNALMIDGHSVALNGNPEQIRIIGTDGNWIERYFTFYE